MRKNFLKTRLRTKIECFAFFQEHFHWIFQKFPHRFTDAPKCLNTRRHFSLYILVHKSIYMTCFSWTWFLFIKPRFIPWTCEMNSETPTTAVLLVFENFNERFKKFYLCFWWNSMLIRFDSILHWKTSSSWPRFYEFSVFQISSELISAWVLLIKHGLAKKIFIKTTWHKLT
jgi:hypothetical protein